MAEQSGQAKAAGIDRHKQQEDVVLLKDCRIGGEPHNKDEKVTVRGDQADWMRSQKLIA